MICCLRRGLQSSKRHLISIDRCLKSATNRTPNVSRSLSTIDTNSSDTTYEIIEPYKWLNRKRIIHEDILKPDYADTGVVSQRYDRIKTRDQLVAIAKSCKIAKTILTEVGNRLAVGVTGEDIDDMVFDLCQTYRCYPSPLNYRGFPKCVTTSVNNVAVHGIPDTRALVAGDIITVDVSIYFEGFHGDCAHTYIIGECSDERTQHLLNVSQLCLLEAIHVCRDGQKLSEIGATIERTAKEYGFNVIREFCGHGIGSNLHEPPQVLHYRHDSDETIKENMCITIEPVITEGSADVVIDGSDGWTVSTEDNSRTAQFEHTLCITKDGAIILTEID
ncbi:unnamed protein product [Oppiella nova]|uniref:Methionine aminopeptidase n=1 Tax=Oppiella nova TaxID=334625 RepID=A0A7R9QBN4_9ACAR|nr:unnamed protein product [Oppiella nova]CAG2162479.1 unnamed protein product [Oppiella nova]